MRGTLRQTFGAIRDDLAAKLPAFLAAEGVADLAYYHIGQPENQEDTWCCVRLASLKDREALEFIIHLALPGVAELDAYGYMQALKNYLDAAFDQRDYGYESVSYELQIFETDFERGDIQTLFSVNLTRVCDDCD